MTPTPAEFWAALGVGVNAGLGLVAYFAFRASRDAADAANRQAALSDAEAKRVRAELDSKTAPHIAPYMTTEGDLFKLHLYNFGDGVVMLRQTEYHYKGPGMEDFFPTDLHNGPHTLLHKSSLDLIRPRQDEIVYVISAFPEIMDGHFEFKIAQYFIYSERPSELYVLHLWYVEQQGTATLRYVTVKN